MRTIEKTAAFVATFAVNNDNKNAHQHKIVRSMYRSLPHKVIRRADAESA